TASFEGIHLFKAEGQHDRLTWKREHLGAGEQSGAPSRGSSEVRLGHLKGGKRFLAAIEGWHGPEVVVYSPGLPGTLWGRRVVDQSMDEGHALWTADVDGDGSDEVLAGFRGKRHGVVMYRTPDGGQSWERTLLDDGIACQGFIMADIHANGHPCLIGIGG